MGLHRIALALTLSAASAWARPATEIPAPVIEVMAKEGLPAAAISIAILDPGSGRLVLGHNPDTPRSPASTIKILTTFAALDLLGPTYTWHTLASVREPVEGGVLGGDLYLQGGGDPYMTLERWWSFAQALRARGLKSIRGDIVIDNSAFSLPLEDPGEFDGKPNRTYNVVPDALMVNFQSIEFHVVPQAGERRVDVIAYPAPANLTIENNVRFTEGRCGGHAGRVDFRVASETWDRVIFSGALSPRCTERGFTRVLLQPTTYAFGTFVELWHEFGGEFSGRLRVEPAPADNQVLLSFDSLTLGEVVRLTNKFSSNLMARDLLLTLGGEHAGKPATPEKGADALEVWSRSRGLDLANVDIDNGSGLSRRTRISALQMANILSAAYRSRYAPEFLASLPLAGMDGTLRSRMKAAPAGAVRLKTGHIDGVSAVAGYVTTDAGKSYVLVSFVNDPRADFGAAEPVHAALVAWILENL